MDKELKKKLKKASEIKSKTHSSAGSCPVCGQIYLKQLGHKCKEEG